MSKLMLREWSSLECSLSYETAVSTLGVMTSYRTRGERTCCFVIAQRNRTGENIIYVSNFSESTCKLGRNKLTCV